MEGPASPEQRKGFEEGSAPQDDAALSEEEARENFESLGRPSLGNKAHGENFGGSHQALRKKGYPQILFTVEGTLQRQGLVPRELPRKDVAAEAEDVLCLVAEHRDVSE